MSVCLLKMSVPFLCLIFNCFFPIELYEFIYFYISLSDMWFINIFPISYVAFSFCWSFLLLCRSFLGCLLLGRKVMTNLDSILKSGDITLPTKVHLVKAMVFPVVMYGCESWTVKKAERQRIDAFELWCWRRLLRVPWTARRSNQSILKEISPGCSLEGMMLKLKL